MSTAIILDDEEILSNELRRMVEFCDPDVKVVAVCNSIRQAEEALNKHHPDLVFLDVELGSRQTGFDLLNKISPINFKIIFTTSYSKYSIQAIKFSALDYLLKPIDETELRSALEKFKKKKSRNDSSKTESLLAALSNPGSQQNKIPLPTKTGYDMVTVADILYCEVLEEHTLLGLNNKKEMTVNMILRDCEEILSPYGFLRIHKSVLVNLNHVTKYIKGKDGTAVLSSGVNLTVSRNFKDKFVERLKTGKF